MTNFWDLVLLMLSTFVLVAYLLILFQIFADLFRDQELGGVYKAIWLIALVLAPPLTAIVYIVARGAGMAARQRERLERARSETDAYIRQAAGARSPAEQIADAKALLDAGTITEQEFGLLKAKALS
ncbi:hypothetical protein CURE108131_03265 [Cupriavidus respiraculi]|uniref:SHOCT domain-containing protein n=1 Tax=Cupriavidus respiraculi TaxID=195930 RepID=A0ABM8WH76_9BURK|nr:hypothetical protein [Cupriavidus respiraculi]MBY4947966.1 hypothetical protein [Cupriavidus respiraculi]CAG9166748.1 hypothetical protein LMG21510_00525 [Cupriavidus respiraculi]